MNALVRQLRTGTTITKNSCIASNSSPSVVQPVPHFQISSRGFVKTGWTHLGFTRFQRGFWVKQGDRVKAGHILHRQRGLDYLPGDYVSIGKDKTIYALEQGHMYVSSEVMNPDWSNKFINEAYGGRKGQTIFKKYVHIHPEPLPTKFNLVSHI